MINPQKKSVIVDTNVAVVSNGHSEQASPECVINCIERLEEIIKYRNEKLVLDNQRQIIKEYEQELRKGEPGFGNAFLKWVFDNYWDSQFCELVSISSGGLDEFPEDPELSGFHSHDKKFIAVSMVHPVHPPILLAIDRKWWELKDDLERNGIKVEFICKDDIQRYYNLRTKRKRSQK
jgi:hypothetical protein